MWNAGFPLFFIVRVHFQTYEVPSGDKERKATFEDEEKSKVSIVANRQVMSSFRLRKKLSYSKIQLSVSASSTIIEKQKPRGPPSSE